MFCRLLLYSYFCNSSKLSILQKAVARLSSSYYFGLEKYSYLSWRVFASKDWMANNKDPCCDLSLKPRTMMIIFIFLRLDSYPLIKFKDTVSRGRGRGRGRRRCSSGTPPIGRGRGRGRGAKYGGSPPLGLSDISSDPSSEGIERQGPGRSRPDWDGGKYQVWKKIFCLTPRRPNKNETPSSYRNQKQKHRANKCFNRI